MENKNKHGQNSITVSHTQEKTTDNERHVLQQHNISHNRNNIPWCHAGHQTQIQHSHQQRHQKREPSNDSSIPALNTQQPTTDKNQTIRI